MNVRWYVYLIMGASLALPLVYFSFFNNTSVADQIGACAHTHADAELVQCLRKKINDLLAKHSASELIETISPIGALPWDCHGVGHIIGQENYKRTKNVELALSQCSTNCDYACIHGTIGESVVETLGQKYDDEDIAHASPEELDAIGKKYCAAGTERGATCHSMGHLLYLAYEDINKALQGCERINTPQTEMHMMVCSAGVFMQASGGLKSSFIKGDVPPEVTIPESGDYLYPCSTLPEKYQTACFISSAATQNELFKKSGITDVPAMLAQWQKACETANLGKVGRAGCFERMGMKIGSSPSVSQAPAYCQRPQTPEDRKACVMGQLYWRVSYESYTHAVNYCAGNNDELRDFCYDVAFQWGDWKIGLYSDATTMCEKANNEPECTAQRKRYMTVRDKLPFYILGLYGRHR